MQLTMQGILNRPRACSWEPKAASYWPVYTGAVRGSAMCSAIEPPSFWTPQHL